MSGNGARPKKIGVLALQGDFEAHERALRRAGAQPVEVRSAEDLRDIDGLVIPGGESTTMWKLINEEHLLEPLREFGRLRPIFGTCAGAILLASEVANPPQPSLGLMDISVERNAYGRQLDSRIAHLQPAGMEGEPRSRLYPSTRYPPRRPRRQSVGQLSRRSRSGRAGAASGSDFPS